MSKTCRCGCLFLGPGTPSYGARCKLEHNHPGPCDFGTIQEAEAAFAKVTSSILFNRVECSTEPDEYTVTASNGRRGVGNPWTRLRMLVEAAEIIHKVGHTPQCVSSPGDYCLCGFSASGPTSDEGLYQKIKRMITDTLKDKL